VTLATPIPLSLPTQAPFTATSRTTLAPTGTTTAAIPIDLPSSATLSGYSGTVTLPAGASVPADTQVTLTLTNVAPSGLPSLQDLLRTSASREVEAARTVLSERSALTILELGFTKTITLSSGLAFVLKIPSNDIERDVSYFLAFDDPANPGLQLGFAGPASVTGSTLTFTGSTSSITLVAGATYIFVLYGVSSAVPSPTPAPTPTATSAPTAGGGFSITFPTPAPVVCSPAAVDVTAGQSTTIDCTAQQYSGSIAATMANPTIASVTQVNQQSLTLFNVTGLRAGTTALSLQTEADGMGSVSVTVSP
jgi:hypothetical protein